MVNEPRAGKMLKEKSCERATVYLTRTESQTRSKSELVVSAAVIHLRADHPLPSLPSRTPRALAALVGPAATAPARSAAQAPPSGPIPPPSAHARHSLLPPSLQHPPRPWSAVRIRSPARRARGLPSSTKCGHLFPCALFLSTIFVAVLASVHFVDKNQPFLVWILALYWLSTKNGQKWPFCRQKGCFEPFCRQNQGVYFHSVTLEVAENQA